ncbi:MAG: metallophosphoesterase [Opitutaceae bacterium]
MEVVSASRGGLALPIESETEVEEPIRILSDLHLGHHASLAREIGQIEPLYKDAATVIFNGDTVEMRSERNRERAVQIMQRVDEFCRAQKAATHFINGNHDPIISTVNHIELGAGNLLVTHGDALFHEVETSWDVRAWDEPEENDPGACAPAAADLERLVSILSANKRAAPGHDIAHFDIPNGTWGQFTTFMKQTWPPKNLVRMVSSWRNNPMHALNLVRMYHPTARCMIVGHTHRPGIWHENGYCVINTGSYLPVLGRMAVDYENGVVTARKVVFRRRRFHLGQVIARVEINGRLREA